MALFRLHKKASLSTCFLFYHIGNCAQNVRIFAYEIKVFLFVPQDWGIEHERIRWMIERMRRAVPRSVINERISEVDTGHRKRKRGLKY